MLIIAANQTAGIGTVIGFGLLILWGIGCAIYWTIQDIKDAPRRRRAAEGNARVDAIRAARIAKLNAEYELRQAQK